MTQRKVGRNDSCPCGSGKKFKQCCQAKAYTSEQRSRVLLVALASLVAAGILFGITSVARNAESGPAAPRQVWSAEHGHYHTIP